MRLIITKSKIDIKKKKYYISIIDIAIFVYLEIIYKMSIYGNKSNYEKRTRFYSKN